MNKIFCDKCGEEIIKNKDKSVWDNNFYMRFGDRELNLTDLCDICLCELEILYRRFMNDNKEEYRDELKSLKREIKQWEETCEILRNPELIKSIEQSLKEFAEGKGIKLEEINGEQKQ